MHLLENVFTNEHGEAITVLQLLTKFKTVLSEIDTYLNEYGNRLNSIDLKNSEQDADILILKSQVASIQTKVNNIQLTLGDYLLRFQDLDIQLGVINGKIDTNITDISNLETNVNNIGIQIININNTLNLLNLTVQGHTSKLSELDTNLILVSDNLSLLSTTVTSHTTSINNLVEEITNISLTVNNLGNSLVTINESITFINNQISGINTSIGNLDGRVDVLENNINTSVAYTHNLPNSLIWNVPNTRCKLGIVPSLNHSEIVETYEFILYSSLSSETILTIYEIFGSAIPITIPSITTNFLSLKFTIISKKDTPYLHACQNLLISGGYNLNINIKPSELSFISSQSFVNYIEIACNKNFTISPIKYSKNVVELLT